MPVHLRPSAPTAADAILCGDPSRALTIAQAVLPQPRMSNHHRGLWGYWGETEGGGELTVQATGIGGPSAVTVLRELVGLGLRRAIRVGTGVAAGPEPALGSALVVEAAIAADGTSAALGAAPGSEVAPDPALTAELARVSGAARATVLSCDVQPPGPPAGGPADPAGTARSHADDTVADLQTAATFTFAAREGLAVAATLAVASAAGRRLEDEPLEAKLIELAGAAAAVLSS